MKQWLASVAGLAILLLAFSLPPSPVCLGLIAPSNEWVHPQFGGMDSYLADAAGLQR
jgi:hypothetical protein